MGRIGVFFSMPKGDREEGAGESNPDQEGRCPALSRPTLSIMLLTDELLLSAYTDAVRLNLDESFIQQLQTELDRRHFPLPVDDRSADAAES